MLLPIESKGPKQNIYYDLTGPESGDVVCFGHSMAADGGMWAEQMPALAAAGLRALRIDMRGHGGSDALPGSSYSADQLADDVIAVVDNLKIEKFHFIGLSIAGVYGQSLGIRYGSRLKSLMLCDTQSAALADAQARWNPRIEAIQQADSLAPIAEATITRWVTAQFKDKRPGRWQQLFDTIVGTSPAGYIGGARALQNFNFRSALPSVKTPTLVVCGADDLAVTVEECQYIAGQIPNAGFEKIAGGLHLPNVEFPEAFNKLMMDWLNAHR